MTNKLQEIKEALESLQHDIFHNVEEVEDLIEQAITSLNSYIEARDSEERLYRHYKGGIYKFISFAYSEDKDKTMVVYQDVKTNKRWVRPQPEFNDKFKKLDKAAIKAMEGE